MPNDDDQSTFHGGTLAAGIAALALLAGQATADPDDPGDGNGDDPDPNQSPNASITFSVTQSEVDATANATDPDGSIAGYDWELKEGANTLATKQGRSVTFTPPAPGTYGLQLFVTDNDGAQSGAFESFTFTGDGNGNGGTPDPNQSPSVSVDSISIDSAARTVTATADGSDPDGSIVGWAWELRKAGSAIDYGSGQAATMNLSGSGDYQLRVTVTDDDGATGTGTHSFPFTAPDPNNPPNVMINMYTIENGILSADATASDHDGSISAIEWELVRDNENITDTNTGTDVTLSLGESGNYTLRATAVDDDGAQASDTFQFPYEDPSDGIDNPDYNVVTEDIGANLTAEVSVFSTDTLHVAQGPGQEPPNAEDVVARYLARALANTGVNARVKWGLPTQPSESEDTSCPQGVDHTVAYDWWEDRYYSGDLDDEHTSKDSNLLLTNAGGGGCGATNGGDICVAGCGPTTIPYPTQDELVLHDTGAWSVMNAVHEVGHNLDQGHASGYAIRDASAGEYRLPPNYTKGGTTYCGEPSPTPEPNDTRILIVSWDQQCSRNRLHNAIK